MVRARRPNRRAGRPPYPFLRTRALKERAVRCWRMISLGVDPHCWGDGKGVLSAPFPDENPPRFNRGMILPQRQRTEKKAGISNGPLRSPERAPNPARPSKVALMIETSNAYSRGVLAGVKDFLRNSGAWNAHLTEHS